MTCPNCRAELKPDDRFCPMCGGQVEPPALASVAAVAPAATEAIPSSAEAMPVRAAVPRKYRALRAIAGVYKACGRIALVAGVLLATPGFLAFLAVLDRAGGFGGHAGSGELLVLGGAFVAAIAPFAVGLIVFLLLYAGGEGISLGIDLEENTRVICRLLERHLEPREVETAPASATIITPASPGRA